MVSTVWYSHLNNRCAYSSEIFIKLRSLEPKQFTGHLNIIFIIAVSSQNSRHFLKIFVGNDATPDAQKEESTNEDVIYDVPTSIVKMTECDTPKKQMNLEMKENVLYENPYQIMKMTECQAYEAPSQIMKMTECPAYEVPSQITNMTECEAYDSLPNRH